MLEVAWAQDVPMGENGGVCSTHRISRAILARIIFNAQLPFTTCYCSSTEAWQCQGLWWLGWCKPQKFVFVSWALKSYLTTWGQERLAPWFMNVQWESGGERSDPSILDYLAHSTVAFKLFSATCIVFRAWSEINCNLFWSNAVFLL